MAKTPSESLSRVENRMADPALDNSELETPRVAQVASMAAARKVELDEDEQREQAISLLSLFVGGGLLAVGWAWGFFFPGQATVGAMVQLIAVVIVSWPVVQDAAEGFAAKDPGSYCLVYTSPSPRAEA